MKKIIFFLLVLFGIEQVVFGQDPKDQGNCRSMFQYGDYYTETGLKRAKDSLSLNTIKSTEYRLFLLKKTHESSIDLMWNYLQAIKVDLKEGKWRNSCWNISEQGMYSFSGKGIGLTDVVAYIKSGDTTLLWKGNCMNGVGLIIEETSFLRPEDQPYVPAKKEGNADTLHASSKSKVVTTKTTETTEEKKSSDKGYDFFADTAHQVVYQVNNYTTNNNYYSGAGNSYQPCYDCYYNFCSGGIYFGWGWSWWSSPYLFSYQYPNISIYYDNRSYSYSYEYNEVQEQQSVGHRKTNPGHTDDNGGKITPGGHTDGNYYGPRNRTPNDGSNSTGSSAKGDARKLVANNSETKTRSFPNDDVYDAKGSSGTTVSTSTRKTYLPLATKDVQRSSQSSPVNIQNNQTAQRTENKTNAGTTARKTYLPPENVSRPATRTQVGENYSSLSKGSYSGGNSRYSVGGATHSSGGGSFNAGGGTTRSGGGGGAGSSRASGGSRR